MDIKSLLRDYKELESLAHVWLDDVIHKVSQEIWELIEAYVEEDREEMYWEASDVVVNVLSVAFELWLDIDDLEGERDIKNASSTLLSILHWKWNQKIQWLRWRYSREEVSPDDASNITRELVKEVLNYADPNIKIEQIFERNIGKFRSRLWAYENSINLRDYISSYQDFPKKWIDFKDISPILKSPEAFRYVCMELAKSCRNSDVIVWLDSRWFLFWPMVAQQLWKPFVMIRKVWKLPWETTTQDYWLEYGSDVIEIQNWTIKKGQKVSIIDDLLATWGTAKAAIDLIEKLGWEVDNVSFVISLDEPWLAWLESRKQLWNYSLNSVVSYS